MNLSNGLKPYVLNKKLSNRHRTTVAQRLPEDLLEKQQEFLNFVLYHCIQHDYPLSLIGNMDETPLSFDISSNTTIEETNASTVSIRTTGHEKSNFTVVLSCMADSTKLPPLIIFKLVNVPIQNFPSGVMICANYLFCGHLTDSVKLRFDEKNTNLAVIPGGLTSKLQPLDVSINKSFKSKYCQCYNDWMAEEIKKLIPTGQIQRPAYNLEAEWVLTSWNQIDKILIQRAFKCCGISNARDGSEDKYIFDYNWVILKMIMKNNDENSDKNSEISENDNEVSEEDIEVDKEIDEGIEVENNNETIDLTHDSND
ncbi:6251_t:CDS:2, partial [Diversispora eburnea]